MVYSQEEFDTKVAGLIAVKSGGEIACAVSGGPDSMALLYLLSRWAEPRGVRVKALIVDHGLRPESADEARGVAAWCDRFSGVASEILTWAGEKPQSRILEEARAARYALLADAMQRGGIGYLCVAHHQDDQAETFLIRLAKGSGLDGLCGMREIHALENGRHIVRPLLDVPKADLISLCADNEIPYVNDPTNKNTQYMRPRLRAVKEILEEEGLSSKRLSVTARRLNRARDALEKLSADLFDDALKEKRGDGFMLDFDLLKNSHEELVLRVLLTAMDYLRPDAHYSPRMEKAEALTDRLLHDPAFNGATLGGCIFATGRKHGTLWIGKE